MKRFCVRNIEALFGIYDVRSPSHKVLLRTPKVSEAVYSNLHLFI